MIDERPELRARARATSVATRSSRDSIDEYGCPRQRPYTNPSPTRRTVQMALDLVFTPRLGHLCLRGADDRHARWGCSGAVAAVAAVTDSRGVGIDYLRADRHTVAARKTTGAVHAQMQAEMTGSPAWAWPWKPGGGCGGVNRSFQFMWCQRVISSTMIIQLPIHSPPLVHCRSRMFRPPARSGTANLPDVTGHLRHRSTESYSRRFSPHSRRESHIRRSSGQHRTPFCQRGPSPVRPSISSRAASRWPACRAVSSMTCRMIRRKAMVCDASGSFGCRPTGEAVSGASAMIASDTRHWSW